MAYAGNPNFANDYGRPTDLNKGPFAGTTPTNPYGYGIQRTMGQSQFQPNTYGFGGGTNTHYTDGMHTGGLGQDGSYVTPRPYTNPMAQQQGYTTPRPHEGTQSGYSGYRPGGLATGDRAPGSPQQISYDDYQRMNGQTPRQMSYSDFANPADYLQYLQQQSATYFTSPQDYANFQQGRTYTNPYGGTPLNPYQHAPHQQQPGFSPGPWTAPPAAAPPPPSPYPAYDPRSNAFTYHPLPPTPSSAAGSGGVGY